MTPTVQKLNHPDHVPLPAQIVACVEKRLVPHHVVHYQRHAPEEVLQEQALAETFARHHDSQVPVVGVVVDDDFLGQTAVGAFGDDVGEEGDGGDGDGEGGEG